MIDFEDREPAAASWRLWVFLIIGLAINVLGFVESLRFAVMSLREWL